MPLPSWISIASGSSKSSLYRYGYFLAPKWAGLCSLVWEGSDHPKVSIIYLSRSTKAPKRKLQANGPVPKKAKKTSSSDSSEDSSEEEKTQGSLAKKAGKGRELGLAVPGKRFVVRLYSMADSYLDLCFCSAVPAKRAILPQHPGNTAAKASESSSSEESSDDEEEDKKKKPVQV